MVFTEFDDKNQCSRLQPIAEDQRLPYNIVPKKNRNVAALMSTLFVVHVVI